MMRHGCIKASTNSIPLLPFVKCFCGWDSGDVAHMGKAVNDFATHILMRQEVGDQVRVFTDTE